MILKIKNKFFDIFEFKKINQIFKELKISKQFIFYILLPYYSFTFINALLEGLCMFLLVGIFTSESVGNGMNLPVYVLDILSIFGRKIIFPDVLPVLVFLFGTNILLKFILLASTEVLAINLRKNLQETIFKRFLMGKWSLLNNFRVGDAVGTNTQEAVLVAKYIQSFFNIFYYLISIFVTFFMILIASLKLSLILVFISLPIIFFIQKVVSFQAKLSKSSALLRNQFSADIIDRLNGLLQVHIDYNYNYHIKHGIRSQPILAKTDTSIAFCQAVIALFNLLVPFVALVFLLIGIYFFEVDYAINFSLLAGVSFLGVKILSNLNNLVSSFGTVSRLSGSLDPILKALSITPILNRSSVKEKIKNIHLHNVSYSYNGLKIIKEINLKITKGSPLIITGRSGQGKTTLANLVAGLYSPDKGDIFYQGISNKQYSSKKYFARIGFVIQDIYLFEGSIRDNLLAGRDLKDNVIWKVLNMVDASDFVRNIGGLDAKSSEAGRSLSGGQKRRLGIARVLLSQSDILIFDEVTAGLDKDNKSAIMKLIERLSKKYLVVVISHTPINISHQQYFSL